MGFPAGSREPHTGLNQTCLADDFLLSSASAEEPPDHPGLLWEKFRNSQSEATSAILLLIHI